MPYVQQGWTDNVTPVDAAHMLHIEAGIAAVEAEIPAAPRLLPTPVVNGQWVKGSGGAAVWAPITFADLPTFAAAVIRRSTNQTIPASTDVAVLFDIEEADSTGMWSAGSPDRLTVQTTGNYLVMGAIRWSPYGAGNRRMKIVVNGGVPIFETMEPNQGASAVDQFGGGIIAAPNGTVFQLVVYQDSGSAIDCWQGIGFPRMSAAWVGQ